MDSKAQLPPDAPGFRPFPLPTADRYAVKNRMSVASFGPGYPLEENIVAVFADKVKMENFNLNRVGGTAKHIMLIANTITLGRGNNIISQSDNRNGGDPDGGSVILICRKMIFQPGSSLFFNGTAINFQTYPANGPAPAFTGSYGSQLLIIAELAETTSQYRSQVIKSHLSAYDRYIQYVISTDARKQILVDNIIRPGRAYLDNTIQFGSDASTQDNSAPNNFTDQDIRKTAQQLRERFYEQDHGINDLVRYDAYRKWRSTFVMPLQPYYPMHPYLEPFFHPNDDYYRFEPPVVPVVIGSSFSDPVWVGGVFQPEYHPLANPFFPASAEVFGGMLSLDALRLLPTEHQKLFSRWVVEWVRFKNQQAREYRDRNNRVAFFNTLREINELPTYSFDAPLDEQYNRLIEDVRPMMAEAGNLVSLKQVLLTAPAGSLINVLTQGIPARHYIPPGSLAIAGVYQNNIRYHGTVEDVTAPHPVTRLTLLAQLQTDPLLASAVKASLEPESLEQGSPTGLQYSLKAVDMEGIRRFQSVITGTMASITIDIDAARAAAVMLRFANTGLPVYLNWSLRGNPAQTGQFDQPLLLKLNRRAEAKITVSGTTVTNAESAGAVRINYVRTSANRILPAGDIRVAAGLTASLSHLALESGESIVDIPTEGITFEEEDFDAALSHFLVTAGNTILEGIRISNEIPASVAAGQSGLTYQVKNAEIYVALVDETSGNAQPPFARSLLSPAGSDGSVYQTRMARLSAFPVRYQVSGKLHFIGGGSANLTVKQSMSPQIAITIDDIAW